MQGRYLSTCRIGHQSCKSQKMAVSTLDLSPETQPKRLQWTKCLFCQDISDEQLSKPSPPGILRLKTVSQQRKDQLYERICGEWLSVETKAVWHKNCYKIYTSQTNVDRYLKRKHMPEHSENVSSFNSSDNITSTPCKTRSMSPAPVDWTKCIFCGRTLIRTNPVS